MVFFYLFLLFFLILLTFIILNILYKKHLIKKIINQICSHLNSKHQNVRIEKYNNNIYKLETDLKKYCFFIETIPTNSTIQINNIKTWEIRKSKNSDIGTQNYSTRQLESINRYMDLNVVGQKIIIFIPTPKKIVMYINECEMIIVNSKTNVYGTNIIKVEEINKLK